MQIDKAAEVVYNNTRETNTLVRRTAREDIGRLGAKDWRADRAETAENFLPFRMFLSCEAPMRLGDNEWQESVEVALSLC